MKKALALLLAAVVFVAGYRVYSQVAAEKCAFISEVSGKAVIARDGKFYLTSGMEGLFCGEGVKVLPGGKVVVVLCSKNLKYEIPGPAEFIATSKKLGFKNGKAQNDAKISAELCPFFMEQSFITRMSLDESLKEVDLNGENLPRNDENTGGFTAGTRGPVAHAEIRCPFNGYLTQIIGDVYLPSSNVYKIISDVVPNDNQILITKGSELSIYSCGEGKKYQVKGPAMVKLETAKDKPPVTFLEGKARKVEDIDPKQCEIDRDKVDKTDQNSIQPAGLDGNVKK